WLGIWVFYYLRFTNYAGIGLIETVMILTITVFEIPTGAIADLLGKKITLTLSFLLETIGGLGMAFSPNITILTVSVFMAALGGTLYSGTLEALVYDSLKENKLENNYDKVISNLSSIQLFTPAGLGIIGGFMYAISPSLPFLANGLFYAMGFFLTFLLIEPKIDSIKFSFKNFIIQSKQGLNQLFSKSEFRKQAFILLFIGFIVVITEEMIDSFLGVEFGFNEKQMGILFSLIYIISALASQLTPWVKKHFGINFSIILVGLVIAVSLIVSPVLGLITGGISLIIRSSFKSMYYNFSSLAINQTTESRFRATTISTFNMIKNIPYVLTAYFIGSISDNLSAKVMVFFLGIALVIGLIIYLLSFPKKMLFKISSVNSNAD
ncbi:MAG: MFS transporter, partial [Patescibacteria group bacterium]|nr:MFS transporter [Patescibacteria group bacterium]